MSLVRCPTCLRTERWSDGPVQVVEPGGQRQPAEHPQLAAWRILRRGLEHGPPVVGGCKACGLPMVLAEGEAEPLGEWRLKVGASTVVVGQELAGPQGTMTPDQAEAFLETHLGEPRFRPREWSFALLALGLGLGLLTLWLVAVTNVVRFLSGFVSSHFA